MFVLRRAGVNLELWQTPGHSNQSSRWLQYHTYDNSCLSSQSMFLYLTSHSYSLCFTSAISYGNLPKLSLYLLYILLCIFKVLPSLPTVLILSSLLHLSSISVALSSSIHTITMNVLYIHAQSTVTGGLSFFSCSKWTMKIQDSTAQARCHWAEALFPLH